MIVEILKRQCRFHWAETGLEDDSVLGVLAGVEWRKAGRRKVYNGLSRHLVLLLGFGQI